MIPAKNLATDGQPDGARSVRQIDEGGDDDGSPTPELVAQRAMVVT
jgi:hypothetical protein